MGGRGIQREITFDLSDRSLPNFQGQPNPLQEVYGQVFWTRGPLALTTKRAFSVKIFLLPGFGETLLGAGENTSDG